MYSEDEVLLVVNDPDIGRRQREQILGKKEFSLSLYHIVFRANGEQKMAHQIGRKTLQRYMHYACSQLRSELLRIEFAAPDVHILAKVDMNLAPADFAKQLKAWTSAWITHSDSTFWEERYYIRAVSPEERTPFSQNFWNAVGHQNCHHIIFTTVNAKLMLPTKYQLILRIALDDVCSNLGALLTECACMRNHIHILCDVPLSCSIRQFVLSVKHDLMTWMQTNPHYRRVKEWSDDFWAFTVSPYTISQELWDICHQDTIHPRIEHINEMAILSHKLGIPYSMSLH